MSAEYPLAGKELLPPPEVYDDLQAREVLRAWVVKGGLSASLSPLCFKGEAYPWGMVLVDIARHVSRAFEKEGVSSYRDAMVMIKLMFDREWDFPTDPGATEKMGSH